MGVIEILVNSGLPDWLEIVFLPLLAATGIWAVYTYSRSRHTDVGRWVNKLTRDFYDDPKIDFAKRTLQYDYRLFVSDLLENRMANPNIPVSDQEREFLDEFDRFLNHFEHMFYLHREGHIRSRDFQSVFRYWIDFFRGWDKSALREYICNFGFDGLMTTIEPSYRRNVAVFGPRAIQKFQSVSEHFKHRGDAYLSQLPDLTNESKSYPIQKIKGKIYDIAPGTKIQNIDMALDYDRANHINGDIIRICIRLSSPDTDAWVYIDADLWAHQ